MFTAIALTVLAQTAGLPAWEFDTEADAQTWVANGQLANATMKDGILSGAATDWDPFWTCRTIEFKATPEQYIVIRMKADRPGECDLFWSGQLEGQYGGLSEDRKARFSLKGDGSWEEVVLFPFWHNEGTIRQLRFDVYESGRFDIDWIRVLERPGGAEPQTATCAWTLDGDLSAWEVHPAARERFAPPLRLDVAGKEWASVRLSSDTDGVVTVIWTPEAGHSVRAASAQVRGDGQPHTYNIELANMPGWQGRIVAFGILLPESGNARLESVAITEEPAGPAELEVTLLQFVNAPNRAGLPCEVMARVRNHGGGRSGIRGIQLNVPKGIRVVKEPAKAFSEGIAFNEFEDFVWEVVSEQPGTHDVTVSCDGKGAPEDVTASLTFSAPLGLPKADYVPAPKPIETSVDVCAYYFPGWYSYARWDCIRNVAPIRKPMLGYYDEANVECVDWQIKWAVENGISCFLVDWYWNQGAESLRHWFDAYKKARYRDQLKVAIMWANHNQPGSHSAEDWRAATKDWIDNYFNLPGYYRIDGKPAVFIWAPDNIRRDLGGSDAARQSYAESQEMARAAGCEGITFVAMNSVSSSHLKACAEEGYQGITTYHEWGQSTEVSPVLRRRRYQDVVATVEASWAAKEEVSGDLVYYPVVDTGWDSRPWHGNEAMAIEGRTPDLFEDLLHKGKAYCKAHNKPFIVLGPLNEWGEGSYIEPATEYGFDMYERVRKVFGTGSPDTWPANVAPVDVGLGGYSFPEPVPTMSWTFDDGPGGWGPAMGVRDFRCEDGALRFTTANHDPALNVAVDNLASQCPAAELRMRITGSLPEACAGQLFWSQGGTAATEATSVRFPIETDGEMHTYRLDLAANSRWRGRISSLRLDPCDTADIEVVIDEFRFTR